VTPRKSSSQNTGEWRGPLQDLLGGKSINRFSSFVTSGAEAFILSGSPVLESKNNGHSKDSAFDEDQADFHYVDAGPSWRVKTPPFNVLVHSPSKRSSVFSGAYTIYNVTSIFSSISPTDWVEVADPEDRHPPSPTSSSSMTRITVMRRFSHFVILHTALSRRLPGIALPPLPEKQYAGRFSDDFVEARRGDLERYLNKIVRHPVVRYAEIVIFFLRCESDSVSG
jgi:sorting nexin-9/18/33